MWNLKDTVLSADVTGFGECSDGMVSILSRYSLCKGWQKQDRLQIFLGLVQK